MHSLRYFLTATSGVPNFPEFVGAAVVDDVLVGYCDSDAKTAKPKQDWMKEFIKDDPTRGEWYAEKCFRNRQVFRDRMEGLKRRLNQTGGVHVLQRMNGCEWDDETGEVVGYNQYGYDGEDFIALDLRTLTWIAPKQQAFITKLRWDAEEERLKYNEYYYIYKCPEWLKNYVHYGKSLLQRTDLPTVSLLQKTPSSPVCCHATGFYPKSAAMFWRRDGEEIHEDVAPGEILPNHDGSFQMSVDLKLSSVAPGDWSRYECVFRLSGVEHDVVTGLDRARIRTNWVTPSEFPTGAVMGGVVPLLLLAIGIAGFMWRWHKNGFRLANTSDSSSSTDRDSATARTTSFQPLS
ncbi:major histocompatibility complex class I-related gene protein-like isoform X2 [Cyclopterus lumpus]|uniref:Ig-like domain-containing protein n=2 Tax=Cyclopterus lumpus TaxID=8103 RepID=A0A8C2X866_CYCLU|nr:major histocompatibility complex class I-related gene protein-like isoform X2 [Cyclopterus lumpus]